MDKAKITGTLGIVAASIGSTCCVGPIILTGLGVGTGVLSFLRGFGFLHLPMMILAIVLLGTAFLFYKKNKSGSAAGYCATRPGENKKTEYILWTATVLTISLFLFPYFI